MANTYTLISSVTVGSGGAANITFSSIPATYTDLLVNISGRCSQAASGGNCTISFNGTAVNATRRNLNGSGSAASSTTASDGYIGDIPGSTSTASTFGNTLIYIPNYASSNNKSFSVDNVTENNATAALASLIAGLWSNSAAITSIKFEPLSPQTWTFNQYSTAYLYGISNA
jgi:hypothetical protein